MEEFDPIHTCVLRIKEKSYEDLSNSIEYIKTDVSSPYVFIKFKNSSQIYKYSNKSITILTTPERRIITENDLVFVRDRIYHAKEVLRFSGWMKIICHDNIFTFPERDVKIIHDMKRDGDVQPFLSYILNVASIEGTKTEDDEEGFLEKEIKDIHVLDKSLLAKLLKNKPIERIEDKGLVIAPWLSNKSQMEALENALHNDISVIQGPPGTGKTQAILNIISNLIIRGKTIAIVSGNNEAIRNVLEKLEANGLDGICAFLGNNSNIEHFLENQPSLERLKTTFTEVETETTNEEIEKRILTVNHAYGISSEIGKLKQELLEIQAEKRGSNDLFEEVKSITPECIKEKVFTADKSLELSAFLEALSITGKIRLRDSLTLRFIHGIKKKNIKDHLVSSSSYLQHVFYERREMEINETIKAFEEELKKINAYVLFDEYQSLSMKYLKHYLKKHYKNVADYVYTKNYKNDFSKFIKRYPIILSTTHSLKHCTKDMFLYDYIIIDEASQVDLCSATIALSCGKNLVLVGDSMQLPHVVQSSIRPALNVLFSQYTLPQFFDYVRCSLLSSITEKYGKAIETVTLEEHFRCDSEIIGFCNKRFYNNQLIIRTKHEDGNGVRIIVTGSNNEHNRTNEIQAKEIIQNILPDLNDNDTGIVTPYRAQVSYLKSKIGNDRILIDTVHKFQGKEKPVMIISTVSDRIRQYDDPELTDFLDNPNLINVAISRAKKKLYVVASHELLEQKGTLFNDFQKYIAYYGSENSVIKSALWSINDMLHASYSPILEKFMKRMRKVSQFDSENIITTIIHDIQMSGKTHPFGFVLHYALSRIIRVSQLKDEKDKAFVSNVNTHCDFVIFNPLDKSPILAIEVDGRQHKTDSKQIERDKRKDRLLQDVGVDILRISTDDKECKDHIFEAIQNAFR